MAETQQFSLTQQTSGEKMNIPKQDAGLSWTASEFIAHDKSSSWYLGVILVTVLLAALAYFITGKDLISTGVILFLGIMFCVVGARKPRELPYQIDNIGIKVDQKYYPYTAFKSFSVVQEDGVESIWFMPLQRFMPGLSIYFAPDEGQKIVDYLSNHLPFEQKELDFFDALMHRIRF